MMHVLAPRLWRQGDAHSSHVPPIARQRPSVVRFRHSAYVESYVPPTCSHSAALLEGGCVGVGDSMMPRKRGIAKRKKTNKVSNGKTRSRIFSIRELLASIVKRLLRKTRESGTAIGRRQTYELTHQKRKNMAEAGGSDRHPTFQKDS
jgi:hypothetical protein